MMVRSGFDIDLALLAVARLRLMLPSGLGYTVEHGFWEVVEENSDLLLQLVHFLAYNQEQRVIDEPKYASIYVRPLLALEDLLSAGSSVWTIAPDSTGLARRVDETTTGQFQQAASANDAASAELHEAWKNAYSFNPDPSDCWDHCIKALEALLKPLIVPTNTSATLGNVVGEIRSHPSSHGLALQDNGLNNLTDPHDTLVGMLRLVWANPDRHQGTHHRTPTNDEARGVLAVTITLVQWIREGLVH